MMISNKAYDILKWVALIALDAIGVCYKTLATIWNWPFGDEVLNTCAAISLFIGSLIGISTAQYNRSVAIDNENCYTQMVKENNELRDTISLDNTFENFDIGEEK
jgi:hypothetical protein